MGSFSDPAELPGLAHFLEHMLFYASAKFPEEVRRMHAQIRSAQSLKSAVTSHRTSRYHHTCCRIPKFHLRIVMLGPVRSTG